MTAIGKDIQRAARLLKEGNLVAIPTETVYGLAADASNREALHKLFDAKGRPRNHPVIVHIAGVEQLNDWVADVPPIAEKLAAKFWPGPLTMIFRKRPHVLGDVTGGQNTVAIRVPKHDSALKLLREFGGGLAAPSANRFGKLSPTEASDVANEFETEVAYVLDGGTCDVGIESTIIDMSGDKPRVLRPGMLNLEMLNEVAGLNATHNNDEEPSVKAPGTLKSHYSPMTPVMLVEADELKAILQKLNGAAKTAAVLSFEKEVVNGTDKQTAWIAVQKDPEVYARNLYGNLRKLDSYRCDWIVVERVPHHDKWSGIADRLQRASFREDNQQ
jgi:L-threonylcarbamoyladenylate synthase